MTTITGHLLNWKLSQTSIEKTSTKRFFDEEAVRNFLQGWDIQFLEENVIRRYESPKSVWEVLAQT